MARPGPSAVLLGVALAALSGCACDSVPAEAVEECGTSQVVQRAVATDVLFVIDDSGSMAEEQELLRAGLYAFIQTLDASPVVTDFQIGVTNTSIRRFTDATTSYLGGPSSGVPYPQGTLVAIRRDDTSGAPLPGTLDYDSASGAFVGPRLLAHDDPTMVADFEANVLVGVSGSGREQPFDAARLALEKSAPGGPNEGFLRPGARLAIVFLSDEDDCSGPSDPAITQSAHCLNKGNPSLVAPADFAAFLDGPIAGERRDVVVAAIVGVDPATLAPSCSGTHCANQACATAADKADRFVELLRAVGPARTRLASICDPSFEESLTDFASVIMSQTLPLDGAPADWRMLAARLERPGVGSIPCAIAPADAPRSIVADADAVYEAPLSGRPASLTFQNRCSLEPGDRVDVNVVCVR